MTAATLWAIMLALGGAGLVAGLVTGSSNLTVGLALAATLVAVLALIVESPAPPHRDRRPW